MIDIITLKGEHYSFDPDTLRIFCDGRLVPSKTAEPVYTVNSIDDYPEFAGIHLKEINCILSKSGKINKITDINAII